jgi:DNA primase
MDVIGVAAAGIAEVVAICGAALTSAHARLIKRHCRNVIINLDLGRRPSDPINNTGWEWTDRAGPAATEKSIPLLLAEGLRPHVLTLEGGQDPDEFIAERGVERYAALCNSARRYYIWLATDRAKQLFDTASAEGRVDAFQYVLRYVRYETNRVEREEVTREVAIALDLDPNTVFDQLRPRNSAQPRQPDVFLGIPPAERLLLTCMVHSDQARSVALPYLNQSVLVRQLSLAPAFEAFLALERERVPYAFEALVARVEPHLQQILEQMAFADTQLDAETAAIQAAECLRSLEAKQGETDRGELRKQIRRLEQEGNFEEAMRLANELDKQVRASS